MRIIGVSSSSQSCWTGSRGSIRPRPGPVPGSTGLGVDPNLDTSWCGQRMRRGGRVGDQVGVGLSVPGTTREVDV